MTRPWLSNEVKTKRKVDGSKKELAVSPKQLFSRRSPRGYPLSAHKAGTFPPRSRRVTFPQLPPEPPASTEEAIPVGISFGSFDFQEFHNAGQRGGGVRELSKCLRTARHKKRLQEEQLQSREGIQQRREDLLIRAARRAVGERIKDDPSKISKALAKRRNRKRQSAKRWEKRVQALQHSVDHCVEDHEKIKLYKRKKGKDGKGEKKKGEGKGKKRKENGKDQKKRGNGGKQQLKSNHSSSKRGGGGWGGGGSRSGEKGASYKKRK